MENTSIRTLTTTNSTVLETTTKCYNFTGTNCMSKEDFLEVLKDYTFPTVTEWVFVSLHIAVFFLGVLGNLLVCFVVWRSKYMQTVTNLFIVNLAVADFLVFVTCQPATVIQNITETWYMGEMMCKIAIFFQTLCVCASVLTLCAIAVERYFAICQPLRSHITFRKVSITVAIIWFIGILVALPNLIYMNIKNTFPDIDEYLIYCKMTWSGETDVAYKICIFVSLYLVPLILMAVVYSIVSHHLWSAAAPGAENLARGRHRDGQHNSVEAQLLSRRKVAKMLIAIVVLFFICYLPLHVSFIVRLSGVLDQADHDSPLVPIIFLFNHWLCYFNSAINPVIYNFMSVKFRTEFRSVFSCSSHPQGRLFPSGSWTMTRHHGVQRSEKLDGNSVYTEVTSPSAV